MQNNSSNIRNILPVMFGFFLMAFVDVVGIATNYVKADFQFSDTLSSLISVACFIWFLILSIPTGVLLNRFGRKTMVLVSFVVTFIALLLPVVSYTFVSIIIAFALIGIGNTILQVSMNPLVADVVSHEKLTGTLTLGQFLKAVCSFASPILASAVAGTAFGWKWIFPVYAAISIIAAVWLFLSPVRNEKASASTVSFGQVFSMFKDRTILLFFIAILVLVGADIGMGVTLPKILKERFSLVESQATLGNSVYFLARAISAFLGGILLLKIKEHKFYITSGIVTLAGLVVMIFAHSYILMIAGVILFGAGYANLFSIIFGLAINHCPQKSNEISALLVTGIAGGALVPPILGAVSDMSGSQTASLIALAVLWIYILAIIRMVVRISKAR